MFQVVGACDIKLVGACDIKLVGACISAWLSMSAAESVYVLGLLLNNSYTFKD